MIYQLQLFANSDNKGSIKSKRCLMHQCTLYVEPELVIAHHNTDMSAHGSYIWYAELGTGVFLHGLIV